MSCSMRWLAGAQHGLAVGVERFLEVAGWSLLIRSMTVGFVGVGVDLARGGRAAARCLVRAAPGRSGEDRVAIEAVEGPQPDQLVVLLAPERPVVRPAGERALEPRRVELDRDLGRPLARSRRRCSAGGRIPFVPAATISSKNAGSSAAASISICCQRRTCGPVARVLDSSRKVGDRLEPAGDRGEPLGERREIAREEQEEASPTRSKASDRRSQSRSSSMSKIARRRLWISRSRSNRASGESPAGSRASTAARCARSSCELADDRLAAAVAEQVVVLVWMPRDVAEDRVVPDEPPKRVSTRS